jgi:hypothetical protein
VVPKILRSRSPEFPHPEEQCPHADLVGLAGENANLS